MGNEIRTGGIRNACGIEAGKTKLQDTGVNVKIILKRISK
jgi:paraquat-inducible protein B